jgi:hypothetical protein
LELEWSWSSSFYMKNKTAVDNYRTSFIIVKG